MANLAPSFLASSKAKRKSAEIKIGFNQGALSRNSFHFVGLEYKFFKIDPIDDFVGKSMYYPFP